MENAIIKEYLKQDTDIQEIKHLNPLCTTLCNDKESTERSVKVFGLKQKLHSSNFPKVLNPNNLENLAYIGISDFTDTISMIEFIHCEIPNDSIIIPFLDILSEYLDNKVLVPKKIGCLDAHFYEKYLGNKFKSRDDVHLFFLQNNLIGKVEWASYTDACEE